MIAVVNIRAEPNYRRDAFVAGLQRAGYQVVERGTPSAKTDFLVTWNRKQSAEVELFGWEQDGGSVLVVENGYIGKDEMGRQAYAISVHGHNGAGWYPIGTEDRFAALGLEPQPWRGNGEHLLVCAQRGIGSKQMASPPNWHDGVARKLRKVYTRPVKVRMHPGNSPVVTTLEADLEGAWACAIWSSASGVKALLSGVPVFYDAPRWICSDAAVPGFDSIESPVLSDDLRLRALRKMAWGQRFVDEIASGEPFVRIAENIGSASW